MGLGLLELLLLSAGVLLVVAGALVVWGERAGLLKGPESPSEPGPQALADPAWPSSTQPPRGRLSVASRYLIGLVLLIWGYHLIVWGIEPSGYGRTAFQVPRQRWWVLGLAGFGVCAASLLVDRRERRSIN